MIAAWMLYAVIVVALCGLMGAAVERLLRTGGWPLRWTWVGALLLSLLLPLLLAYGSGGSGVPVNPGAVDALAVERAVRILGIGAVDEGSLVPLNRGVLLLWGTGSLLLLGLLLRGSLRLRSERRGWRRCVLAGVPVLVSPNRGPAVFGFLRTSIVVPERLLDWEPGLQRLVIAHEREHVRAGDPVLGLGAFVALVLAPWNVALWWQVSRLRTAIELDCDARVLDRSPDRRRYGELLLRVGAGEFGWLAGTAFTERNGALERRIRAIVRRPPKLNLVTFSLVAAGVLAVPVLHAIPVPPQPDRVQLATAVGGWLPDRSSGPPSPEPPPSAPEGAPDGADRLTLPGTPSPTQVQEAIARHHPGILPEGLSPDRAVWFVVDEAGQPVRTGISEGADERILSRVRTAHPGLVSDYMLVFEHPVSTDGTVRVLWLIPEPTEPVPE